MTSSMTPDQAQEILDGLDWLADIDHLERALRTLAEMRTEHDYRIVDPETNGGKYEIEKLSRLVGPWN